MSTINSQPDYLITDEITLAHSHFVSCNRELLVLWSKLLRGFYGVGTVAVQLTRDHRFLGPALLVPEERIIDYLPSVDWSHQHLITVLGEDGEMTIHFLLDDTSLVLPASVAAFTADYTQEDDFHEVVESSNNLFIESQKCFVEGDFNKSEHYLIKVIQDNPLYSRAYSSLACIRWYQEEYPDAIQLNLDALRINPNSFRALYNIGLDLYDGWYVKEAAFFLKRCINCYGDFEPAHELLVKVEERTIEIAKAQHEQVLLSKALQRLKDLGARDITHELTGTTKMRINFPFRDGPEDTENGKEN